MPRLYVNGVPRGDDETALNLITGAGVSADVVDNQDRLDVTLGAVPQQQTATLTLNRAGGFVAEQVFDLGQEIASVSVVATLTATTADGETFGTGSGQINAVAPQAIDTSLDNVTFTTGGAIESYSIPSSHVLLAVADTVSSFGLSGRYLKVFADLEQDGGAYAGANDPEATVELTVSYT